MKVDIDELDIRMSELFDRYCFFQFNDSVNREGFRRVFKTELQPNFSECFDYMIKCDEENNTPTIIDQNKLALTVFWKETDNVYWKGREYEFGSNGMKTK